MLTAVNLLSMMNVKVGNTLKLAPPEGVVAVLQGDADAMIFVGGKPVKLFKNLEELRSAENKEYAPLLQRVHFVPLSDPRMLEEYQPAEITPADYDFVKENIPTIAVTAVLMSFDFADTDGPSGKQRCAEIGKLADAVRSHLKALKATGHPKWKEVDLNAHVGIWKRGECAWSEENKQNLTKDLLGIIGKGSEER
jgi:TRAP-type uncharacterized transport system substrate-binding protein